MLAKEHRLTSGADFRRVSRTGRRAGTKTLVLHADFSEESGSPLRVGFVVGRSVGNAVIRNRVKRRLRALVRARLLGLPAAGVLVVRALPASAPADSHGLGSDLDRALARVVA